MRCGGYMSRSEDQANQIRSVSNHQICSRTQIYHTFKWRQIVKWGIRFVKLSNVVAFSDAIQKKILLISNNAHSAKAKSRYDNCEETKPPKGFPKTSQYDLSQLELFRAMNNEECIHTGTISSANTKTMVQCSLLKRPGAFFQFPPSETKIY